MELHLIRRSLYVTLCLLLVLTRCTGEDDSRIQVVAHIGNNVTLSCDASGCPVVPKFLWQHPLDKPLEGTTETTAEKLTFHSIQLKEEGDIMCKSFCDGQEHREKMFKIVIYSFPEAPLLKWKSVPVAGKTASIICEVHNVYPPDRMNITLIKDGKLLEPMSSIELEDSIEPKTVSLEYEFVPTSEDNEKNITCIASLDLENLKGGEQQKMSTLTLSGPPRNIAIMVFPSNTVTEGEGLMLNCSGDGSPTPNISWHKKNADGNFQLINSDKVVIIQSVSMTDSGLYKCEATNEVGHREKSVEIIVKVSPRRSTLPAFTSANTKEQAFSRSTIVPASPSESSTISVSSGSTTVSASPSESGTISVSSGSTTASASPSESGTISVSSGSTLVPLSPSKSSTVSVSSGSTTVSASPSESGTISVSSGSTVVPASPSESVTISVSSGSTTVDASSSESNTISVSSGSTLVPTSPFESNHISARTRSTTNPDSGYQVIEESLLLPTLAAVSTAALGLILATLFKHRKDKQSYNFGSTTV